MIYHLGCNLRETKLGLKLTRENYAVINKHSSFSKDIFYNDDWCKKHLKNVLTNFDLNMEYFDSLDKLDFNKEINAFLKFNFFFTLVSNLKDYEAKKGYYLIILDEYSQAYLGTTNAFYRRIKSHWHKRKEFDRLIFGGINKSKLSIDSFRALDITRIYVYVTDNLFSEENQLINNINGRYMCNRTIGGKLEGGLLQAIKERKTRDFK